MPKLLELPLSLDLDQARRNLLRQAIPDRVFYFEHGLADNVKDQVADRFALETGLPEVPGSRTWKWQREIAIQRHLGFELFRVWLPGGEFNVAGSLGTTWAEEHVGPIQSWEDLERYLLQ